MVVMMIDQRTPNLDLPLPNQSNLLSEDVGRLVESLTTLDAAVSGKASATHNHDGVYASVAHAHDGVYAPVAHNHAGVYAPVAHNHDGAYLQLSAIGMTVQAYDAGIATTPATQAEMAAGTQTGLRSMSPLLVAQAIAAKVSAAKSYFIGGW